MGIVLLPFNVNRIHKHIKNPNMTQENTHRFIYIYRPLHTKKKKKWHLWLREASLPVPTPSETTLLRPLQEPLQLLLDETQQEAGMTSESPQSKTKTLTFWPGSNPKPSSLAS